MNSVRLFAWLGFAPLLLVACSEGAYSPNSGTPYLGNGMNQFGQVNPGIPQNGMMPGMMPGMNPLMNPMMDPFGMMGAQARLNGGFYFNGFWNMGCGMRRTTSYTPQQCACAQAPCDCQQQSQQCSGTINADSKTLPLTLTGADARALYQRLAREEVDTKNRDKTKVRTGTVIKCMKDGRGKKDKDYACDFDISVADGRVFEFYPVGKPGAAAQASDSAYSGTNLEIGGAQLNTNEAIVKLRGRIAAHLFKKMGMEAKPGNIAGNTAANIKNGMNLKCFETLATAEPITECQIKLRVETGEVISN